MSSDLLADFSSEIAEIFNFYAIDGVVNEVAVRAMLQTLGFDASLQDAIDFIYENTPIIVSDQPRTTTPAVPSSVATRSARASALGGKSQVTQAKTPRRGPSSDAKAASVSPTSRGITKTQTAGTLGSSKAATSASFLGDGPVLRASAVSLNFDAFAVLLAAPINGLRTSDRSGSGRLHTTDDVVADELALGFAQLDVDRDGVLSPRDLEACRGWAQLDEIAHAEIPMLLQEADADGDGLVTLADFRVALDES